MKGQARVVTVILLVLIILAIAASIVLFGGRMADTIGQQSENRTERRLEETKAGLSVNSIYEAERRIELKNTGEVNISNKTIRIYINNNLASQTGTNCPERIQSGSVCNITTAESLNSGSLKVTAEYSTGDQVNLTSY
ncbi:MAG: hypothetical protein ACLFS3_00935 [Candidatus Aenigmatarchaeota archaeon]